MKKYLIFIVIIFGLSIYNFSGEKSLEQLPKETKILAFGDSLTYGIGVRKKMSYPSQLERMLRATVISSGIPGEISKEGLSRFKKIFDEINPDIVVLCHGGNDILRNLNLLQTKENIKKMIQIARAKGAFVVLVGVPQKSGLWISTAPFYDEIRKELSVAYEGDILASIVKDSSLKSDLIHPNKGGYKLMAEAIKNVILEEYH